MPIIERDVVHQGQENGQETIDFPLGRWGHMETSADDLTELADGDLIPVADASDQEQPKRTTWSAIKAALANLFAAKDHAHAATEIASGTLASARLPTMPISKGGTGKTSKAEARKALGAAEPVGPTTITLTAAGWTGEGPWTQTVSVEGVTAADDHLHVYPVDVADDDARKLYEAAYGCLAVQAESVAGGITFVCREKKPETNFDLIVGGVRA